MKARVVFTLSGSSKRAKRAILTFKQQIESGELQREMERESKVGEPFCRIKATFEMLED